MWTIKYHDAACPQLFFFHLQLSQLSNLVVLWFKVQYVGWSEPAATNAPVQDDAVEAVFKMNQKHILPAWNY